MYSQNNIKKVYVTTFCLLNFITGYRSKIANLMADNFVSQSNVYATTFCLVCSKQVSGPKIEKKSFQRSKIIKEKKRNVSKVLELQLYFFHRILVQAHTYLIWETTFVPQ